MSVLFAGTDAHTGRPVAIKSIRPQRVGDADVRARFRREVKIARTLQHPNVVAIYDSGEEEDAAPYVVMELLDGHTLEDELRSRGRLPVTETLEWIFPLFGALAVAHDNKIVHRDIKPSNIFLSKDLAGRRIPKLLDFGTAIIANSTRLTKSGVVQGTVSYMSPEQANGAEVGPATDVWAMGVVLYRCLAGVLPFDANATSGILDQIINEPAPPLVSRADEITPRIGVAVDLALSKDAGKRYHDMRSFAFALCMSARAENIALPDAPDPMGLPDWPRWRSGKIPPQEVTGTIEQIRTNGFIGDRASGRDDLLGTVVQDRYRVISRIGEGGMGVVYEVEHLLLGRRFALKTLLPERARDRDRDLLARFHREARATAAIGDKNIVEVSDMGYLPDGAPFIVMELLEGRDLRYELETHGPLPVARAVRIAIQCCRALHNAHEKGIVHRDLKPDNIFLTAQSDDSDFVKILDFGICRFREAALALRGSLNTKTGMTVGTPEYMSPEQIDGVQEIGFSSDIYTLGVVLFQMLTGRAPFEAANYPMLVLKITREPPPRLTDLRSDIPPALQAVVDRAMAKKPDQRFGSMSELAEALIPFADFNAQAALADPRFASGKPDTLPTGEEASKSPHRPLMPFTAIKRPFILLAATCAVAIGGLALFVPGLLESVLDAGSNEAPPAVLEGKAAGIQKAAAPSSFPSEGKASSSEPKRKTTQKALSGDSDEPLEHLHHKAVSPQPGSEPGGSSAVGQTPNEVSPLQRMSARREPARAIKKSRRERRTSSRPDTVRISATEAADVSARASRVAGAGRKGTAGVTARAKREVSLHNSHRATVRVLVACSEESIRISIPAFAQTSVSLPAGHCRVSCTGIGQPQCPATLDARTRSMDIR